jgi:hypothetical protein
MNEGLLRAMICRKGEASKKWRGDKRNDSILILEGRAPARPRTTGRSSLQLSEQFNFGEVLRVDEADGVVAAVHDNEVADAMGFE